MPFRHTLQTSRYELKYIVEESRALAIRDFVRGYLELDEYGERAQDCAYAVFSLYLDTPELALYRQTIEGLKNRFKLRIRFYDGDPESPAYLEIKRRVTDVIRKERAGVTRRGVRRLLDGGWPGASELVGSNGSDAPLALRQFCELCLSTGATARTYVAYRREAYVSANSNKVRVTFDRQLRGSAYTPGSDLACPENGAYPNMGGVILELKFTDTFPAWMRELVQAFNLHRRSVPKYIRCTDALRLRSEPGAHEPQGIVQWTG
jgi:hypothetical protein